MELHLHLSAAFRALDRQWGAPVDLDTSGGAPGLPAAVDRPADTFSSEHFLRAVKRSRPRPKPYSRGEQRQRRDNVKRCDSFSDISLSRFPSRSDLGGSVATLCSSSGCSDCSTDSEDLRHRDEYIGASTETLDSVLEKKRGKGMFKQLKKSAISFIENKRWKKLHL